MNTIKIRTYRTVLDCIVKRIFTSVTQSSGYFFQKNVEIALIYVPYLISTKYTISLLT